MARYLSGVSIAIVALCVVMLWLAHRIRWSEKLTGNRGFTAHLVLFYISVGFICVAFGLALWAALLVR
jgi:hypothetical protein